MSQSTAPSNRRSSAKGDEELILLDALPKQPEQPPPTDDHAFPVHTFFHLVDPGSLVIKNEPCSGEERAFMKRDPKLHSSSIRTIFISPPFTLDEIRDHLATDAQGVLGVSVKDRWRWACLIVAKLEDVRVTLTEENVKEIVSLTSKGKWSWEFWLIELERSSRGVWESTYDFVAEKLIPEQEAKEKGRVRKRSTF